MLWWESPGLSSIISHALMSLPKTWLWVRERENIKEGRTFQDKSGLNVNDNGNTLCRNRCMQLAGHFQRLRYPHVHLRSYGADFCQTESHPSASAQPHNIHTQVLHLFLSLILS